MKITPCEIMLMFDLIRQEKAKDNEIILSQQKEIRDKNDYINVLTREISQFHEKRTEEEIIARLHALDEKAAITDSKARKTRGR